FGFAERGIAVIGPVPGGLPTIALPDVSWRETLDLLPVAASCFVVIIAQGALAHGAGARSQIAHLVFAGIVLLVLLALTGPLQYLPRSVLAAIVFTIAVGMIDVAGLRG